jgi:predicted nucleic acid-binding protein
LARNITSADLSVLVNALTVAAERVDLAGIAIPRIVRDPDDDYLIAMAVTGNADVLVSGDHDVLGIANLTSFRIMSMRDFADLLNVADVSDTGR